MFRRLGKWLVVLALVFSTGGQWFVLQSVAWLTMAVNFAQSEPLTVALKKTFDGKHPCRICKTVEEGRKSEQKQNTIRVETKLEFCFDRQVIKLAPPALEKDFTSFSISHNSHSETPPTPPPRAA